MLNRTFYRLGYCGHVTEISQRVEPSNEESIYFGARRIQSHTQTPLLIPMLPWANLKVEVSQAVVMLILTRISSTTPSTTVVGEPTGASSRAFRRVLHGPSRVKIPTKRCGNMKSLAADQYRFMIQIQQWAPSLADLRVPTFPPA